MNQRHTWERMGIIVTWVTASVAGQALREPDRGEPGDVMIQEYMRHEAERIDGAFLEGIATAKDWRDARPALLEEYLYMLGLWPLPAKTDLHVQVTGTLDRGDFLVDKLHYQSRPGLYVTANLYRPKHAEPGKRLPAILYVCGHSNMGRDGNKTNYQAHGIWFARHGYICLTVDTLQLGEIASIHHGTYREKRWWWHSRGYTPAGVECWNGIRGIDYLISRPDVDPERIGVTGISGGGAATFWVAAADERVKVAVPVSGMADLVSYVPHRVINGHCDCMFMHNAFSWPWTQIAALVAPRPLLFVNSYQDRIFPMDANERVINRLERLYSLFGAGHHLEAMVSIGGHAYREDIRKGAYRFLNIYLKGDPSEVTDSEIDLVFEDDDGKDFPIPREELRVFPADSDLPTDALNAEIDRHFVPMASVAVPAAGEFDSWKQGLLAELRRVTFRRLPERMAPAQPVGEPDGPDQRLTAEEGAEYLLTVLRAEGKRSWLVVLGEDDQPGTSPAWMEGLAQADDRIYLCEPRGIGRTRWTRKNPPNYVERCHALLGWTVDTGRVWDIAAAARFIRQRHSSENIQVVGRGPGGVLGAYAALFEPEITGAVVLAPPTGHMEAQAPQFLNVLRVCDLPEVLGMLAPRPLILRQAPQALAAKARAIYNAAGVKSKCTTE